MWTRGLGVYVQFYKNFDKNKPEMRHSGKSVTDTKRKGVSFTQTLNKLPCILVCQTDGSRHLKDLFEVRLPWKYKRIFVWSYWFHKTFAKNGANICLPKCRLSSLTFYSSPYIRVTMWDVYWSLLVETASSNLWHMKDLQGKTSTSPHLSMWRLQGSP